MPKRPRFRPKPGQTDYSRARWAPVINCVVMHRGKLLLVERSRDLHFYPGCWNGISGFLDDHKSLAQKVKEELLEEIGVRPKDIAAMALASIFDDEAPRYKKTWIVHAVLVELKTDKVHVDWEARRYAWVSLRKARTMKLIPPFARALEAVARLTSAKRAAIFRPRRRNRRLRRSDGSYRSRGPGPSSHASPEVPLATWPELAARTGSRHGTAARH